MQENLRSWDGVLLENHKKNYELNRSLFYDRKEFKTELAVERSSYRKSFNDLINDNSESEEENEDFRGNRHEDYMEHEFAIPELAERNSMLAGTLSQSPNVCQKTRIENYEVGWYDAVYLLDCAYNGQT